MSVLVRLIVALIVGLLVGFAVQRSRFCFVGAFQDAYLFGLNGLATAVIILAALASAGYAVVRLAALSPAAGGPSGAPMGSVFPVGWHTVAGGLFFGLGMVLAGSCALTTLTRVGEGAAVALFALGGLVAGSFIGRDLAGWWTAHAGTGVVVHLPTALGWPLALVIQAALLGAPLYLLTRRFSQPRPSKTGGMDDA
ncbi:MAG: YeeE/YedE thiosulfate transporter family protein [Bacillota bacterium]